MYTQIKTRSEPSARESDSHFVFFFNYVGCTILAALFPCLVPSNSMFSSATTKSIYKQSIETPPAYWKKTIQDVTQLKLQIEDLKKVKLIIINIDILIKYKNVI